jgi:hypothetical protein
MGRSISPLSRRSNFQLTFSSNIPHGVLRRHQLGPHFTYLKHTYYTKVRQIEISPYLEGVSFSKYDACGHSMTSVDSAWRCTPTFRLRVYRMIERKLSRKVDRRHGPVIWPSRSPDLNQLDFFLGCCKQSRMYRTGMLERGQQVVRYTVECNTFRRNIRWTHVW